MILGRDNNKIILGVGDKLKARFSNSEIDKGEELRIVELEYFVNEDELGLYFEGKDLGYTFNKDSYLFDFYTKFKTYKEIANE